MGGNLPRSSPVRKGRSLRFPFEGSRVINSSINGKAPGKYHFSRGNTVFHSQQIQRSVYSKYAFYLIYRVLHKV